MRTALFLALLGLCAALFAAEPHPSLPAIGSLDGLGVNIHFTDPQPGELAMIRAAGFRWVRMDLTWAGTERKPGEYDFAAYDRLVAALEKHGMKALFILDYGNPLYAEPGDRHPFTSRAGTEEFRAAFAKWAAAAVSRYAGKGILWEIWNEPNHAGFWKPKPDVQQYIALAKAAGAAIRAAAPKEAIIGPATSTIDLAFLEECMKAGLLELFDAVSVHPYRQTAPETVEEEYRSVRLLIRKYAPKDKAIPVLSGEWGYSTAYPAFAKMNDTEREAAQAKYITRMFLTNIANDVPLSIWYDWRDDGDDPKEAEHRFGLVRRKYRAGEKEVFEPKPAYRAVQTLTGQLAGMRLNKRFGRVHRRKQTLLFGEPKKLKIVAWGTDDQVIDLPYLDELKLFGAIDVVDYLGRSNRDPGIEHETSNVWDVPFLTAPNYFYPTEANGLLETVAAAPGLPLEFFLKAPGEIQFSAEVQNLDRVDRRVRVGTKYRSRIWTFSRRDGSEFDYGRLLAPGAKIGGPISYPVESRLWPVVISYLVEMNTDNTSIESPAPGSLFPGFVQESSVVMENAVTVGLEPHGEKAVRVTISNPSGQAFDGNLVANPFDLAKQVRLPLNLSDGQRTKEIIWTDAPIEQESKTGTRRLTCLPFDVEPVFGLNLPDYLVWEMLGNDRFTRGKVVRDGEPKIFGDGTIKDAQPPDSERLPVRGAASLSYRFGRGWKFLRIEPLRGDRKIASSKEHGEARLFALWIHGDGKGCQARIRFKDATGQTFQSDGPKIDFTGWRYVKFTMYSTPDAALAHWGGASDGEIHYPIQWDSIFLLDNVSREPVEGEVYLSAPTLIP